MKKRTISILLVVLLAVSLASCARGRNNTINNDNAQIRSQENLRQDIQRQDNNIRQYNNEKPDNRQLEDFGSYFLTDENYTDGRAVPYQNFEAVGAIDALELFIANDAAFRVYMYESFDELRRAQQRYPTTVGRWPFNGRFAIDTNDPYALYLFGNYNNEGIQ
ncbi:MAG: hypothetical protein FWG10_14235 [Eubacteriaceae bacterium]|nr:hypothetical protein [Eubacteriaceae bacterium]